MASSDRIDLSGRLGPEIPQHIADELSEAVSRVVSQPDANIDAVLQRTKTIAANAADGRIRNLVHYANKALFGLSKKVRNQAFKEPIDFRPGNQMERFSNANAESSIQAAILFRELMADLPELGRNVVTKYMYGFSHREIGQQLGISEEDSRFHLASARQRMKARLEGRR